MSEEDEVNELLARKQRIRFLWSQIYPPIEEDPGLIWTDEIRDALQRLEKESEKILLILRHLKSHYEFFIERFPKNAEMVSLIQELISHIENLKSEESWIAEVYQDIKKLIEDLEGIGNLYRLLEHQLNDRLKLLFRYHPAVRFDNLYFVPPHGQIFNLLNEANPVFVQTGSGAIVNNMCEVVTNDLRGCVAVFIFGPHGKALLHMIPKGKLPYEEPYLAQTASYVMESINIIGADFYDYTFIIMGNMYGNDKYKEVWGEWRAIKTEFTKYGIRKIKIVEMPLEQTTLYHSNIEPYYIFVIGKATYISKKGKLITTNKIHIYKIPISPDEEIDFGIKRS